MQQGAFARARGTNDRYHFPTVNFEGDISQNLYASVTVHIMTGELDCLQHHLSHGATPVPAEAWRHASSDKVWQLVT